MRVKPSLIITTFKRNYSAPDTANELGIHPTTVYRWIRRARTGRNSSELTSRNLKRRSTKPHSINYSIKVSEESEIIKLRQRTGYGADKIRARLKLSHSWLTVHRFLKKKGVVREYGYHRRPRFQDTVHMHVGNAKTVGYLQMDVKYITPELSGLTWTCFEYAVIDIYSRYKEAVILNHLDVDGAMAALLEILPKIPFKVLFIQTDNGLEFQGRFLRLLKELGIKHHFVHKNTPNENAVIERSFRTDEEEFFFMMEKAPIHYDELRNWFANYLHEYNYDRPHFGIKLQTPYEVVANVMLD